MEKVHYMQATEAEIEVTIRLRMAFTTELNGMQPEADTERYAGYLRDYLHSAIQDRSYVGLLAMAGDKAVACGGLVVRVQPGNVKNPTGRWGYIMNMYTMPEYRRQGIARNIVDKLVEAGKEIGVNAFELHATEAGAPVYEQAGFHVHTEPTYRKFIP